MWHERYVGIPFEAKGRTFEGCDCWGLNRLVMLHEKGIIMPDYLGFYEKADNEEAVIIADKIAQETAMSDWVKIPSGQEQPLDGMLIRLNGMPCHVGIVVKKNYVLHIAAGINSTIEDYRTNVWKVPGKVVGFYRHKELCKN